MGLDCEFGLGPAGFELPLRFLHQNIKSRVGAVYLELKEEVKSGHINFHVLYKELKLWIRI